MLLSTFRFCFYRQIQSLPLPLSFTIIHDNFNNSSVFFLFFLFLNSILDTIYSILFSIRYTLHANIRDTNAAPKFSILFHLLTSFLRDTIHEIRDTYLLSRFHFLPAPVRYPLYANFTLRYTLNAPRYLRKQLDI